MSGENIHTDGRVVEAKIAGKCNAKLKPYCEGCNKRSWDTICPECGMEMPEVIERCEKSPMVGRERCRFHGGATPRGVASPHFRHGRFSKNLPTRMISDYERALADPEMVAHREDIALLDARLEDVLRRVDSGESGQVWKELRSEWQRFTTARANQDGAEMASALEEVGRRIGQGYGDYVAWGEVRSILEQRRKMAASERDRLIKAQLMMPIEKAMALMGGIEAILKTHINDPVLLMNIGNDILRLTAGGE